MPRERSGEGEGEGERQVDVLGVGWWCGKEGRGREELEMVRRVIVAAESKIPLDLLISPPGLFHPCRTRLHGVHPQTGYETIQHLGGTAKPRFVYDPRLNPSC